MPKVKEIEQNVIESIFKLNKYYDYDEIEYKAIRDVANFFDRMTNKDYYKIYGLKVPLIVII